MILSDKDKESIYLNLFDTYYTKLVFYAQRFLDEEEAEDVVQDVFFELWKQKSTLDFSRSIKSWLYRVVYTRSLNVIKHNKVSDKHSQVDDELNAIRQEYYNPEHNNIISYMESNDIRDEIDQVMVELPEKCRECFKMSYLHGMKNQEIADILDISVRTVEAHMYKALKYLRIHLKHLISIVIGMFLLN